MIITRGLRVRLKDEQKFQESLVQKLQDTEDDRDQYLGGLPQRWGGTKAKIKPGLSLRQLIHEFKHQTLILFKCCLLQPKVLKCRFIFSIRSLKLLDAIFRFSLRTSLHDAVFTHFPDTWSHTTARRLCGSRVGYVREDYSYAYLAQN